jgi:hypothetical protein
MTASYRDIKFMMNITPGIYWKFCWGFFIPLALIAILIYFFVTYKPITYQVHKLVREKQNLAHFFNCNVTLIIVISNGYLNFAPFFFRATCIPIAQLPRAGFSPPSPWFRSPSSGRLPSASQERGLPMLLGIFKIRKIYTTFTLKDFETVRHRDSEKSKCYLN